VRDGDHIQQRYFSKDRGGRCEHGNTIDEYYILNIELLNSSPLLQKAYYYNGSHQLEATPRCDKVVRVAEVRGLNV
jgi:hypothetical protein